MHPKHAIASSLTSSVTTNFAKRTEHFKTRKIRAIITLDKMTKIIEKIFQGLES